MQNQFAAQAAAATDARESRSLAANAGRGGPMARQGGFDLGVGLHLALGGIGFIPIIGTVANAADASIYAAQGDFVGAGLSAAAAIPLLGEAADAAKEARIGAEALDEGVHVAEEASAVARAGEVISAAEPAAEEGQQVFRVWGHDPNPEIAAHQSTPWGESWTRVDQF